MSNQPERGVSLTAETVVVPVEPTEAMIDEGRANLPAHARSYARSVYQAMLSAAREPEGGAADGDGPEERAAPPTQPLAEGADAEKLRVALEALLRWDIYNGGVTEGFVIEADFKGEWVRYDDIDQALAALQQEGR